jgi:hypothetical protein
MPRLIDDLRAGGKVRMPWFVQPSKEAIWIEYAKRVTAMANEPELPVMVIDNVADYLYMGTDQEHWSLERDFPNLAPPFPMFWVEFKMARTIHSKEQGDTDVSKWLPQGGRVGQLFMACDRESVKGEGIPENTRWVYWCDMFCDYGRRDATADGPQGAMFLCVDADGRAIGAPWMQSYCAEEDSSLMKNVMAWYHPTFLAISFLHCKNVQLVDNAVDAKLAKRHRERHGIAPTDYKTLIIEPLKQVLRQEGRVHENGLAKAMHICRGHFADYTQGRGLFGKYHGKYWMPAVVRGTKGKAAPARAMEVKV